MLVQHHTLVISQSPPTVSSSSSRPPDELRSDRAGVHPPARDVRAGKYIILALNGI